MAPRRTTNGPSVANRSRHGVRSAGGSRSVATVAAPLPARGAPPLLAHHHRHARDYGHAVALLDLTPDQLLSTTRAVRRRLDLTRPVPDDVIRECVAAALQAPAASNSPTVGFVVVRDEATRKALGEIYRQCYDVYRTMDGVYIRTIDKGSAEANAQQARSADSADHLGQHMGDVPVLVVPYTEGLRVDGAPAMMAASVLANVLPAMWSFMLAARARGLGTAWTTVHLMQEQAVAELLGMPFATTQQVCLSPLAYTIGTEFHPADRPEAESVIHWDRW